MKSTMLKGASAVAIVLTTSTTVAQTKEVSVKESTVNWIGKKITGKHNGTVDLQRGTLQMKGDEIVGGTFVIDMNSIEVKDLTGDSKEKLEGHLKSDDFFGVATYPTATLDIKSANKTEEGYYVNAEITIKGTTEPIAFELKMDGDKATTSLKIDRTKFGVRYGSGSFFDNLGDNTIYDNFEMEVSFSI